MRYRMAVQYKGIVLQHRQGGISKTEFLEMVENLFTPANEIP